MGALLILIPLGFQKHPLQTFEMKLLYALNLNWWRIHDELIRRFSALSKIKVFLQINKFLSIHQLSYVCLNLFNIPEIEANMV